MDGQLPAHSFFILLTSGFTALLAYFLWQRRRAPGSKPLALLMIAVSEWSLMAVLEDFAIEVSSKVFWSKIQYLGIASVPILFLIFALQYSQQDHRLTRRHWAILWTLPVITVGLVITNEWHHLIWAGFSSDLEINILVYHHGPWFWIHFTYNYIIMAIGSGLLLWIALRSHRRYRYQTLAILVAIAIPWVVNAIYVFNLIPLNGFDPTPIAFGISGFVLTWGLYRFQLFDLAPIARDKLLDTMRDIVIVADNQNRILDLNPAAQNTLGFSYDEAIGKSASQVLRLWPYLSHPFSRQIDLPTEVNTIQDTQGRWYDLRISPLRDQQGQLTGYLIVMHDVTQRIEAENRLTKQAAELQTVAEISVAIATTLDADRLIQEIVDRTQIRFQHYHTQIFKLDDEGEALILVAGSGNAGRQMVDQGKQILVKQTKSLIARAARTRKGVFVNNVQNDPGFLPNPQLPDTCSEMAAPLVVGDQLLGVLDVQADTPDHFSPQDLHILTTLASQAAVALHNARTFDSLQVTMQLLSQRRAQLHEAMQVAKLGRYEFDPATQTVTLSDELYKLFDTTADAEGGYTMSLEKFTKKFIHPADVERLSAVFSTALSEPETAFIEREYRSLKNDLIRHMLGRVRIERDDKGRVINVSGTIQDISEHVQTRAEVARLAAVIDQAHETVVLTDLDGNIEYANPQFEIISGYTPQEAIGQNPRILKSGHQGDEFYQQLWDTISRGDTWQGTFINKRKNEELYHEAATIFPIKKPSGEITHYAAVKRDITAQVQAEALLSESEERYRLLFNSGNDAIFVHPLGDDLTLGKFIEVNDIACQRLGFTKEELLSLSPTDIDAFEGTTNFSEVLSKLLSEKYVLFEQTHLTKDGRKIPVEISAHLFELKGQPTVMSIARDITERKKADQEMLAFARYQTLLNDITSAALEQADLHQLLQILADRLGELINADGCYITLVDEDTSYVLPGAAYGPFKELYRDLKPPPGEITLTASVLKAGHPLAVEDVFNSPHISPKIAAMFPEKSMLGLPLIANDKKLGAVLLSFEHRHSFTYQEITFGEQAAGHVALAIAKAQALESAQRRMREAETLRQAGAAVAGELRQEETINRIMEQLNYVVPYDSASVQLLRDDKLEIVGGRGFSDPSTVLGLCFPVSGENPSAVVFTTRQPYILEDAPRDYTAFLQPPHKGIRSWMGIPIILQDRLIGVISLDSFKPGTFIEEHAQLAVAFADQVAVALENARLYQEALANAENSDNIRRAIQEISAASLDPEEVYAAIFLATSRLMPTDAFVISLFDETSAQVQQVFLIDQGKRWPPRTLSLDQCFAGYVIRHSRSILIDDFDHFPQSEYRFLHFGGAERVQSGLAVPMKYGKNTIGVLFTQCYKPNAFSTYHQQLLELIAAPAAVAMKNAHLYAEVHRLATVDPLTSLYNRRHFLTLAKLEFERARRYNHSLSAIMLDIDHFKRINDTYGHTTGDIVLHSIANACRDAIRKVDILGRYGGEEFVVLLPETNEESVYLAAERLRLKVAAMPIETEKATLSTTISLGVHTIKVKSYPHDVVINELEILIDRADQALLNAKQSGRNRVSVWQPDTP